MNPQDNQPQTQPQTPPTTLSPQPAGVPGSTPPTDPNKTVSIVGLVLSFTINLVGLIISIIAFNKSKKAGYSNPIALAGIIVGSILTTISVIAIIIFSVIVVNATVDALEECNETGASVVYYEGEPIECPK